MIRKITAFLTAIILFTSAGVHAQEAMIADIDTTRYNGFITGGGMEPFIYVPHFISREEKTNFAISQLNPETLIEEQLIPLEIPETYTLLSSGQSMGSYLLLFYDSKKKEHLLITVVNKNIAEKKTINIKNDDFHILNANVPEGFITLTIDKKGNFTLEKIDQKLESKWKKSIEAPSGKTIEPVNITAGMEGINILSKETGSDGKLAFVTRTIQPENGEIMGENTLKVEDAPAYPTFTSMMDGMGTTGGYYFNNGKYSNKPDGIFIAMSNMEGGIDDFKKVPYSQVIEDLKSTVGSKLSNDNTGIVFIDGIIAHGTQTMLMTGQVLTKKDVTGGCIITASDIVTLKFNFEKGYIGANTTKMEDLNITLNGDVATDNVIDIGVHLSKSHLLPVQGYAKVPDQAIVKYHNRDLNNMLHVCYKNAGLKEDTSKEMCVPLADLPKPLPKYNYVDIKQPMVTYNKDYGTISSTHDINKVLTYDLREGGLFMRKMELPDITRLVVMEMPEEEHEEEHEEEEHEEDNGEETEAEAEEE